LLAFFGVGLSFANLNALAMAPLGDRAGMGASVVGAVSTGLSLLLGAGIGQCYDGTLIPLVTGFALLSGLGRLIFGWVEKRE